MTRTDRLALELALEQIRKEPGHAEQIDQMLTMQSWSDDSEIRGLSPADGDTEFEALATSALLDH